MVESNVASYCRFYIVRHGESELNLAGLIAGQLDSPLTESGREQAKKTGQLLQAVDFKAAFSSDLKRARETAEIILEGQSDVLPLTLTPLLRERHFGRFQGTDKLSFYDFFNQLPPKEQFKFKEESGEMESEEDSLNRLLEFINQTAPLYLNQDILVSCHGGLMYNLLYHLGKLDYGSKREGGKIANASYLRLLANGKQILLLE
ncbi:histidine phosphatase family protein [Candidatus Daviesbacteria bacterium]|nr:histidine phosphatase family protein [Candidatus Daviesbacteria bacterium]